MLSQTKSCVVLERLSPSQLLLVAKLCENRSVVLACETFVDGILRCAPRLLDRCFLLHGFYSGSYSGRERESGIGHAEYAR